MKTNQSQSRIGGVILAFALLFGTAIAFSATVQAQDPNREAQDRSDRKPDDKGDRTRRGREWDGYGNYGGSNQLRQTALNAGYNEGIKRGHKYRNRDNDDFQSQSAYKNATKDYSSRLGDRETYRRYYREGYETGHRDGVNGF
jgi:hypothetical protein